MTEQTTSSTPRGGFTAQDWWVLMATVSASGMAFVMQSALSPALPIIQVTFEGASAADLLWVMNAYSLLLSAFLLLGGSMGDLYGRKRVYVIGIIVYAVSAMICGLAPSIQFLIGARAVQGIGGALMVPGSLAIISAYFPDNKRGRAIGTWSAFTTAASLFAPVVGGVLADAGLWRGIFFLTIPFALFSLYALYTHVPESRNEDAPKGLDVSGTVLIALALFGIVYGATEIGRTNDLGAPLIGELFPANLTALILGIVAVVAFVWVESRSTHPLVPLRLFISRTFTGVNIMTLFLYGALAGALTFLPLLLIQIQGYSASVAGIATLPVTVLLMVISPWAGGLIDRVGPRLPLIAGPTLAGIGFAALGLPGLTNADQVVASWLPLPVDYFYTYLPGLLLLGVGMGITVSPLTTAALGSVPQHNSGVASGINNLASRAAGVLALAIMGGIALVVFTSSLTTEMETIALSDAERTIILDSADNLAETIVPDSLDGPTTTAVESAIDVSFLDMFRILMVIAAVMCWVSATISWRLVENELKPPEELLNAAERAALAARAETS